MGRTVTLDEIKDRTVSEIVQEAVRSHQPLIVTLENGDAVTIQQYDPSPASLEEPLTLEPLPQFSVGIPKGWKEAIYDHA